MTTFATPEEAAALFETRDSVGMGLGPANPHALLSALGGRDDWEDLIIGGALLLDYYNVFTHPGVSFRSGFFGPIERMLIADGKRVELVPGGFRQFAPILARFSPRVMIAQGNGPDADGNINLSLHVGGTRQELLAAGRDPARVLMVEVNPQLPRTSSLPPDHVNTIPAEVVDVMVATDSPPFALGDLPTDDTDAAIAQHAMAYVTNGSTLQTGIGAIPNMVATQLSTSALGDFGIHSEMFTDGLMKLHVAGKVTNAQKGVFDGASVTTFALGSQDLYTWLDGNADVVFLDAGVVNDPGVIGQNANFVSINGALSVDLYGQIVADNIGGRQISGVGGHEDFVAGAELRLDAHSLICLRSTAVVNGAPRSRIVGVHPEGTVIATPRHHTGVIVTEYGAAELAGLTVRERAHALVEVAHPDFRADLRKAAEVIGSH
jgi:acyl-CoA hydrolase